MRTASRWMLRGFLLATGGAAAVALGAGPAFAGQLTVTYTGAPNPTTNTPLTWSVSQNPAGQMSCELDFGATVVSPLADCGPTVTYSVAGQSAGTYTLVAYGDPAASVTGSSKTLSSSIVVAPVAPTPSGPTGPSNDRAPQWALGLPAGATGACTLTNSGGTVVATADPCPDPWTGPLGTAADGTYTLRVVARQGGLTSAPGTLTYRLDTTAPSAATVTAPSSPRNDRTPTFTVTGVEAGASVTCTATGPNGSVPMTSCTATSARPDLAGQPDGSYQLSVVVTDAAGNASPSASASYTLDATPPPAPTVSAPPALTRQKTITLTIGDAEAGTTLTCLLTSPGGSTVVSGACPANGQFDTTGFGDGVYTLDVTATDPAGNAATTSVSWQRDSTPPPAPAITGPTSPVKDRTPTLHVSDAEPGVTFDCAIAGPSPADVTTCGTTTILDLTGAADGDYVVLVTATDAAGNSRSSTFTVTLDTTAPPAPVITGPTAPVNDRTPSVSVSDSESGVAYSCSVSGPDASASVTACGTTTTLDLTTAADGDYLVTVTASDAAGNTSSSSFTLTLDTLAPPAPTVSTPVSPTRATSVTVAIDDTETGVNLTCRLRAPGGATVSSGTCPANSVFDTSGFGDGLYTLVVTATDAAGNSSSTTVTWTRDTTAPPAPLVTAASPTRSTSPTVTISDAEGTAVLSCVLTAPDGTAIFSGACPADGVFATGSGDGDYTLVVTATDAAGNSSSTSVTWTLDTTAPPSPTVTGPAPLTNSRSVTATINDTEAGVSLTCLLTAPGGATVFSGTCPPGGGFDTTGFGDGVYTLRVTATDAAGNKSVTTVTWTRDTVAPPVPVVSAPASPAQGRSPSFGVSDAEPGVTFTCTVTGPSTVTITACGATTTIDLTGAADGTYVLHVTATDAAGNVSAADSVSYVLDTTAPPAPSVSAPPALTRSRQVTLSISDTEPGVTLTCVLKAPGGAVVRSGLCPANGVFDTTGFSDGVYTLRVTATDFAGNATSTTVSWTRDTTAPPVPVVRAPRSPDQSRTPSFTVSDAESGVVYTCTVSGPSVVTVLTCGPTTTLALAGAADGTYTLSVTATDPAGNVSASTTATYVLDTTPPAQPDVTVTPSPAPSRHPSFGITGVESGGIVSCSLSAPSGATVSVPSSCAPSLTLDLSGQPDGSYTLTVTVTDAAGNVSVAGVATYLLDTTAPAAPTVAPPAPTSNDTTPTFDIGSEPGATLTCTIARFFQTVWSGPCPADGTLDLTGYADGEFEVTVYATDAAGNVGSSTTAVYMLDTTAPERPVLTAPASPSPVTQPVWRWTAEAGSTATCTVTSADGTVVVGPVSCATPWTADLSSLPDAPYTFSVVVTDAAGNESPAATAVFVLDRQAPVPPDVVPPRSPDNDLTPTWLISAPRGAVLTCTLLQGRHVIWGPAICPADGTFSLAGLPDGTYTLRVTATDHAGNVSAAAVTTYVLDTTPPPAPTLDYGTSSPSADTTPFWGFTLPPGTTGRCQLLRGGVVVATRNSCGGAVRFDLAGRPEGTYVVKIWAIDAAGNMSQALVITYVLGHASPPPPTSSGPVPNTTGGTPSTGGGTGGHRPTPPALPTGPGAARQPIDELNRLSSLIRSGAKHTVQGAENAVSAVIPVIHDKITENVSHAVQGVVNAVSAAGGGTGFPVLLLFVVLAFLLVQNRIDSRDPKLALASVAADDTVEFLPPPSRGGDR